MNEKKYYHLLIGHAVGDSLLLPYEFLNKKLCSQRFKKFGLKQSLICGIGFTSDDNDHLLMTTQALISSDNVDEFRANLAKKLKFWLLCLPVGAGMTTIKAIIKLWLGYSPKNSGINSSGNGPLMRVPIIALKMASNKMERDLFIEASTLITHKSAQALSCSKGVANFIAYISQHDCLPSRQELPLILISDNEPIWQEYISILMQNLEADLDDFLEAIKCSKGVSGYIMPSAAFSIYVLYQGKNYFETIIKAGGDTDSIGALVGSCLGILGKIDFMNVKTTKFYPNLNSSFSIEKMLNHKFWISLILKNLALIPIVFCHGIYRKILIFLFFIRVIK